MRDVVSMGETMALFTANHGETLEQCSNFSRSFGGSESNLAIALARLGHCSSWVSRLGDDGFGRSILKAIRGENVHTGFTKLVPNTNTGLYFKSLGGNDAVALRYYRKLSAFSRIREEEISPELGQYLGDHAFFFISGITLCLGDSCFLALKKALQLYKQYNPSGKIVFDLNIRAKLWNAAKSQKNFEEIFSTADILLCGLDECQYFNINNTEKAIDFFIGYGISLPIIKLGDKGALAYIAEAKEEIRSDAFPIPRIVDPVGAGDAFAAGFLSGLLDKQDISLSLQRANALAWFALSYYGDFAGLPSKASLENFLKNKKNSKNQGASMLQIDR